MRDLGLRHAVVLPNDAVEKMLLFVVVIVVKCCNHAPVSGEIVDVASMLPLRI